MPFVAKYGTTETGPSIASTHWPSEGKGKIGLLFYGCTLKLVAFGDRYDLRAQGPNLFPENLGRPDLTAKALAKSSSTASTIPVHSMDPADPSAGLRFAGRLSEKFKRSNGT